MTSDARAETPRPTARSVRRLGWLLGAVALAVVAGLVMDQSGLADDVAHLGDADRWTHHHDPDSVAAVAAAPDGDVWAGTHGAGLVRWQADGSYRRHEPERAAGELIRHVTVADDGTVWAAVSPWRGESSDRLLAFDGQEWRAEPVLGGDRPDAHVRSLALGDAAVWVATSEGLARFDGDGWTTLDSGADGSPLPATSVVVTDDGTVWAAVSGEPGRVIRLGDDGQNAMAWPTDGQRERGPALADKQPLATGPGGSVWLATVERTTDDDPQARVRPWRFADGEWIAAAPGFDVPHGHIQAFAVDGQGRPWLALDPVSEGGPVWRFDGRRWQRYGPGDGVPHESVGSLTVDDDGAVWAATPDGVGRFADGEWTRHATGEGPASDFITGLATGQTGSVWAAGGLGVSHFDGRQWTSWTADDGLAAKFASQVAVGPDGGVLATAQDGVFRFDGEQWARVPTVNGLSEDGAQSLTVGPEGGAWVGAHGRVARFDGEQWHAWTSDDGLPYSEVRSLTVDGDGAVWAATRGGVAHFDGDGWQRFTDEDGLPSSSVTAVALGTGRTVWAGTEHGLARFDGQRWTHADRDDRPLELDGDPPVARAPVRAVATGDDGTVWAATDEVLSAFDGREWHTTRLDFVGLEVRALVVDDAAAWVASPRGLVRFDRGDG